MTANERIKEIRKTEQLTLAEFSNRLGITHAALSNIENSKRNVTDQMIKSICREFGYREEWLRDGIEPKQPPKLEEDEIAEYIEDLLSVDTPTYTLIKIMLKTYISFDAKSKQAIDTAIGELISGIKKEVQHLQK